MKEVCLFYCLYAQLLLVVREFSKEVQDKFHSVKLFFPCLDLLITLLHRCSCLAGPQFPVWSCMDIYVSFIWIACLTYYTWSFISAMWM